MTREEQYARTVAILGVQEEPENLEILLDWIEKEGLEVVFQKALKIQERSGIHQEKS